MEGKVVSSDHTLDPIPDEDADKKEESNGAGEVTEDEEAGPIQFTGPTNPRQKAVVEAFQVHTLLPSINNNLC